MNGNGKVPLSWLLGLLTTIALGAGALLYSKTDAKAEAAKAVAEAANTKAIVTEAYLSDILRRLTSIEAKLDRAESRIR